MRNCKNCMFAKGGNDGVMYCMNYQKSVSGNYFCSKHIAKSLMSNSNFYSVDK